MFSTPKDTNIEIAGTTNVMLDLLSKKHGATGYAASTVFTGDTSGRAFPICLNGYGATVANVNAGNYPYWNYEHAYVKHAPSSTPTDVVGLFLRYVCGADFQNKDLRGYGFLRISDLDGRAVQALTGYPETRAVPGDRADATAVFVVAINRLRDSGSRRSLDTDGTQWPD